MYEMYPEWGPARHRDQDDSGRPARRRQRYWEKELAMAGAPASRDGEGDRPDDN